MSERPTVPNKSSRRMRCRGQGMVEYVVILSLGVLVLLGPGVDVVRLLADVLRNNYRSYSYAMSMSPLPDFGNGPALAAYIDSNAINPRLDQKTIDRLTVDPVQSAIGAALNRIAPLRNQFNNVQGLLGPPMPQLPTNCRQLMQGAGIPINC